MPNRTFIETHLYKTIAMIVVITVIAGSIPQKGWGLMFGVGATHAAPRESAVLNAPLMQAMENAGLTNEFADLISPDGQPNGLLMDVGARQAPAQYQPDSLANPISVSRVQSAYRAADAVAGTLVVTFTITNNQPPVSQLPTLPAAATITESIAAISTIDFAKDPNTIHNVLLADMLTGGATFVRSSPAPDRAAPHYAWNLGDIPPLTSVTAVVTMGVPASVPNFTDLDAGATAWGTLQGRSIRIQARPVSLAPDTVDGTPIGDWLRRTIDADTFDQFMLQQAAELGQDPARMFEFVRSLTYESYRGSLRGTRGTLWSAAGNSLDKASLLIAMLRASGIPARYRHGRLSTELAQRLIVSMFPKATQLIGHIPSGTQLSDPAHNQQLLSESQDHWWVEVYLPGQGWRDLDPAFADADIGQSFSEQIAIDGTDRIAEVPRELRHQVTLTVKIEQYEDFPPGRGLPVKYPLNATFNTVELVGRPVTLGHFVNSFDSSRDNGFCQCGVFRLISHTYTPFFAIEDRAIYGQAYDEMTSNFPFGTHRLTGAWLLFAVRDPSGQVTHHQRELVDRIGVELRQSGGTMNLGSALGTEALFNDLDTFTALFNPAAISPTALIESRNELLALAAQAPGVQELAGKVDTLPFVNQQLALRKLKNFGRLASATANQSLAFSFGAFSDRSASELAATAQVRAYADSPRITIISSTVVSSTIRQVIDLLHDPLRVEVAPGQSLEAGYAFRMTRGIHESVLETSLLEQVFGQPVRSVPAVMEAAKAQHIPLLFVDAEHLEALAEAQLSTQAKARILATVKAGDVVVVPARMVDFHGQPAVGWWQIDPASGETVGVGEDGTHQGTIEYSKLLKFGLIIVGAIVLLWVSGLLGVLMTVIYFIGTVIGVLLERRFTTGLWQEAFNRTKSFMLHLADEVERVCAFC